MNIRKHNINIKRSIVTLSCLLFSVGVMAQAYSSGGGSATGYSITQKRTMRYLSMISWEF